MKILIAIDGSKSAQRAVKYAIDLAQQLTAQPHITLVTVHDDTGLRHLANRLPKDGLEDYFRELSERDLKPTRKLLDKAGVPHDMVIKLGHVVEEILSTANAGKFDMLVVGSKGRSGLSDLVLGSVAQRLSALARQPVVLVK
ncbi:MAG: universal stress protein [Rhodoferax sp.]|nr:universal stress protein [Rhodoferax sp.]